MRKENARMTPPPC